MKRSIFFLAVFVITLATGCNELEREVVEQWTGEQPKLIAFYKIEGGRRVKVKEEKFYENGQMEYTGEFTPDGHRQGMWKYWYPNGNLWSEGEFEGGRRTGLAKVYYENGQLRYSGRFNKDKEVGNWTFYKQDGSEYNKIDFDTYQKTGPPEADGR